jgi:hypothetical protein
MKGKIENFSNMGTPWKVNANCRHLKNLLVKGLAAGMLIEFIDWR